MVWRRAADCTRWRREIQPPGSMNDLAQQLVDFIQQHQGWAGPILFITAFGESLAIVNVFVPGTAILIAAGALIPFGAVDPVTAVIWSVPGAVLGDSLSYWVGRRFHPYLPRLWPFDRHPEMLARGEAFFRRFGVWSVAIGRWFGPVRAVVPLIAGCLNMKPLPFQIANIGSALVWSPSLLAFGALAGTALRDYEEPTLVILGVLAAAALLAWTWRRFGRHHS
jgi:membrane protein DedA with SNARE-associated domain